MSEREKLAGDPFGAEAERHGRTVVVKLRGELDLGAKTEFDKAVPAVDGEKLDALVLDMRELTFADSSGLRMVLETSNRCRDEGVDFAVVRGRGHVRRLFELAGLELSIKMLDEPPGEKA